MDRSRRTFLAGAAGLATLAVEAAARAPQVHAASPGNADPAPDGKRAAHESFSARSADGVMLTGEAQGDPRAPEILFIHGLRQSRLSWEKQFADPALARFRMVSFDLRGHGDSDKPTSLDAYSDADLWADDLAAVIAGAKLRRPVLVGWSLGGFVIGAYLRKYGGSDIAGINLVDAVTKLSPDLFTEESGVFARTTMSHDLAERTQATADFLSVCFHQPPSETEMLRMLVINGMTSRAVNEGILRTKTADFEPFFRAYAGPILSIHGAHDRLVRIAMSERIQSMDAKNRLSLFPDSGHSPFYDEPARYGKELATFVTATDKS